MRSGAGSGDAGHVAVAAVSGELPAPHFDAGQDVICRRCLTPGRGWTWAGERRCEPCHRAVRGDKATDELILSSYDMFGEWWTDEYLDRMSAIVSAEVTEAEE